MGSKDQPSGNTAGRREGESDYRSTISQESSIISGNDQLLFTRNIYQTCLQFWYLCIAFWKNESWKWTNEHQESFMKSKEFLKFSHLLFHYDPERICYLLAIHHCMVLGSSVVSILSNDRQH